MFRCENGPCIDEQLRCNDFVDCPYDSSDELDCNNRKSPTQSISKKCTSLEKKKTPHTPNKTEKKISR